MVSLCDRLSSPNFLVLQFFSMFILTRKKDTSFKLSVCIVIHCMFAKFNVSRISSATDLRLSRSKLHDYYKSTESPNELLIINRNWLFCNEYENGMLGIFIFATKYYICRLPAFFYSIIMYYILQLMRPLIAGWRRNWP